MEKSYLVVDVAGLHARPASLLVQVASKFPNEINIEYNGRKMTLKSIMAVMSLGVPSQETFKIEVLGEDCETVFNELENVLIENSVI